LGYLLRESGVDLARVKEVWVNGLVSLGIVYLLRESGVDLATLFCRTNGRSKRCDRTHSNMWQSSTYLLTLLDRLGHVTGHTAALRMRFVWNFSSVER